MALYTPIPSGPIDSGSLSPNGNGGFSANLPSLQPFENYLNQSGLTTGVNSGTPTVLDQSSTQSPTSPMGAVEDFLTNGRGYSSVLTDPTGVKGAMGLNSNSTGILGFIASPTRIGTAIVGVVLLAGGVFLLGKGPAVNVIVKSAKDLATGA